MFRFHSLARHALLTVLAVALLGWSARAEEVIKALTALPAHHDLTKSFNDLYVKAVNEAGKGIVRIEVVGGPEVTPANKAAPALQRGVFDMLHSPAAYYAGITPQSPALMATNRTVQEIRANGGFDIIAGVWKDKLNAKIVAWGESGAQFHLYLVREPPMKNGKLDLTGVKIRSTGAYRPLINALGGSPVQMPVADVYTALERGLVDGFGWPTVGLKALGLHKAVKYRIDPPFYHLANLVLVNYDRWNKLPKAAQDVLLKVGAEYEMTSYKRMQDSAADDEAAIKEAGVKIFKLEGPAADAYLAAAYGAAWKRIGTRIKGDELKTLRAKMYQE